MKALPFISLLLKREMDIPHPVSNSANSQTRRVFRTFSYYSLFHYLYFQLCQHTVHHIMRAIVLCCLDKVLAEAFRITILLLEIHM